jgi:phosphoribosylformylglycinamidine synthase
LQSNWESTSYGKRFAFDETKYPNEEVIAPGTVISAAGNCIDINKVVEPVLQRDGGSIYYINLSQDDFKLGGSSLAQTLNYREMHQQLKMLLFQKSLQYDARINSDNQILAGHRKWRTITTY